MLINMKNLQLRLAEVQRIIAGLQKKSGHAFAISLLRREEKLLGQLIWNKLNLGEYEG